MGNILASGLGGIKNAGGVEGLLQNPMFNVGMGLLQSNNANFGENSNPFTAALGGLQDTQRNRDLDAERKALEKARKRQDELNKRLQELYGNPTPSPAPPGTGGMPTPAPPQVGGMSPAAPQPSPFSQLGSGWGSVQAPWQTPGINPNAPPIPAPSGLPAGGPFGTSVTPPTSAELSALMVQYGSPSQQQAALTQMSTGERFRQGLAAEETRYARGQEARNKIGQYNPRDYTTESWGKFIDSGDPAALKRYERVREFDLGGGRSGLYDASTGQAIGETIGRDSFESNVTGSASAHAQGSAQGSAITAAQQQLAGLESTEAQLTRMFADENFSDAVGPLDAVTGRVGEMFGSDEGVLGGEVQRTANRLVTDAVSTWKGAISERELQFFMDSVPGRASSPETWKAWYENEYLPRKRLAERVASGEVFHDDRLVTGASATSGFTNLVDQDTADALAQYGVQVNP